MSALPGLFPIPGLSTLLLEESHLPAVQHLLEQCSEFNQLVSGEDVPPGAAREEYEELPPGRDMKDKYMLGFFSQGELVGLVDCLRNYPEEGCWWIGLFLLSPAVRGKGFGRQMIRAFEGWVRQDFNAGRVGLGVVEENRDGYQFWEHVGYTQIDKRPPRRFGCKMQSIFIFQRKLAI
jgi:GNAT superfamily N-acetyltransferase